MGYHLVDVDELTPLDGRSSVTRSITEATGLEVLGIRVYETDPGAQLPLKYHYHEKQEEAFYVLSGELHVETPDREYVVEAGQMFVVEPNSPHRAFNPESAEAVVRTLAVGAPTGDPGRQYEA